MYKYYCHKCGETVDEVKIPRCPRCGGVYELSYRYESLTNIFKALNGSITHWKYYSFMPINYNNTKIITMGEGGTPLILSRLNSHLLFKCEYINPTGSFKDRASSLEVTLAQGKDEIVVATTGNMGSSLAAYAAFAGMKCRVFMPEDIYNNKHSAKVTHMEMCGAIIVPIKGDYTAAMLAAEHYYLEHPNSYLAGDYGVRIEGTKSVGFEICDQLGWEVPDYIVVPVGNGTLLRSIHKAFIDLNTFNIIDKLPKIIGVKSNDPEHTIATAIACPKPSLDHLVTTVAKQIITVTDDEIMIARRLLALQGMYVEPGGAAAYAGYKQLDLKGTVVILLTGHGLKSL